MKSITQTELDEALEKHRLWLFDEGGERLDLSRCNLSRLNISGADFEDAIQALFPQFSK